jgi:transcriptional regulator with XRE-family HTH domain
MGMAREPKGDLVLKCKKPKPQGYPAEPRTLGEHIRKRRLDLGLLQKQVGQRIGACVATVWLWEADRIAPELKWWPAIIGFLGYDPRPAPRTVGERLVRYREARGWSQKRLAEALKIDPSTLSRWELGKKVPWGVYRGMVARLFDTRY